MPTQFGQVSNTTDIITTADVGDSAVDAQANANQSIPNNFFTPVLLQTENFDTDGYHDTTQQDSGTATGTQTATTLQDTTQSWAVNVYQDMVVNITGGTGAGQARLIASNTSDTLTISGTWGTTPDGTSTYEIVINNRLTVPTGKAGLYEIYPKLTFAGSSSGLRGIAIYKNTTFINSVFSNPVGVVESIVNYPNFLLELAVGDWVEMRAYQTTGGDFNILGASSYKVFLQMALINGIK